MNPILEGLRVITQVDRVIHEPLRLVIMTYLSQIERTDFLHLMRELKTTQGNLGAHMTRLEEAGYVTVKKTFVDKKPHTSFTITPAGQTAVERYWEQMGGVMKVIRRAAAPE